MKLPIGEVYLSRALTVGLCCVPLVLLYVNTSFIFPYFTGKAFAFRLAVSLLFVLWSAMALLSPRYRPARTPVFVALSAMVVLWALATVLSPNPSRAFWSNFEKMDGFITLLHLYLLFVMAAGLFRSSRDWHVLIGVLVATSSLVCVHAVLERNGVFLWVPGAPQRVQSITGNAAFLAPYVLLHFWLTAYMAHVYRARRALLAGLLALSLLHLVVLYYTGTRAGVVGLFLSLILVCLLATIFFAQLFPRGSQRVRGVLAAALLIGALSPLVVWLQRDASWVQETYLLKRFTNPGELLDDYEVYATLGTRLRTWGIAWRGVVERPLAGWGMDNFYLVFQKYYDPALFAKREPWYDRPHNNLLRWALDAGVPGLCAQLAVFAAAFFALWKGVRGGLWSAFSALLLSGFFISYLAQGLLSYDTLYVYIPLFVLLAYVGAGRGQPDVPAQAKRWSMWSAAGASACCALFFYGVNVVPLQQIVALERAQVMMDRLVDGEVVEIANMQSAFDRAIGMSALGRGEVREELVRAALVANDAVGIDALDKERFLRHALREMETELERPAKDTRILLMASVVAQRASRFDSSLSGRTEAHLIEATQLSPTKQHVHFSLAQFYLDRNDRGRALEILRKTWDMDRRYPAAARHVLIVALAEGRADIALEVERQMDPKRWTGDDLRAIGKAYWRARQPQEGQRYFDRLRQLEPQNAEAQFYSGVLSIEMGQYAPAAEYFAEAVRLDSTRRDDVRSYLDGVRARSGGQAP